MDWSPRSRTSNQCSTIMDWSPRSRTSNQCSRSPVPKRDFYARAAEWLAKRPGLKPQELLINLVEVAWENWSFGDGKAQYTE
jgi:Tautomerase enzyme